MYLDALTIERTFQTVATLAEGSMIACDFLTEDWLQGSLEGKVAARLVGAFYGEPC